MANCLILFTIEQHLLRQNIDNQGIPYEFATVCEILTPDRDREPFREWLLQSHSQFLNPVSGFTIITAMAIKSGYKFLTPDFLKITPETAPEMAPEMAPDPEFHKIGNEN